MALLDTNNFVYFVHKKDKGKPKSESQLSDKQIEQILETLANQAIKDKTPTMEELESILQNLNKPKNEQEPQIETQDIDPDEGSSIIKFESISQNLNKAKNEQESKIETQYIDFSKNSSPIIKLLQEKGYLRDKKNWLTHKGFLEIGSKILDGVMKDLTLDYSGSHDTRYAGDGNVLIDSTKKFELGNDIKFLNVPQTILNSIQRISKHKTKIDFPISLELDDFEEFETLEDVKVAVVYCIDLSSTMKKLLGKNGKSRIEAAKKALWSLYVLNKKFFPDDSIFVVGFGTMASIVNNYDIPFLKTYDAHEAFLHYTNYQAALRLARKILQKNTAQNKRIVMITDGQPSACFVENEQQKNEIVSEKPYWHFYEPDTSTLSKVKKERNMTLDFDPQRQVYLSYRYKRVDPKIHNRTLIEAKKCLRENIKIDTIVISEEEELLEYVQGLEKELKGKVYHINQENMDKVLVHDYLSNTRKVLSSKQNW